MRTVALNTAQITRCAAFFHYRLHGTDSSGATEARLHPTSRCDLAVGLLTISLISCRMRRMECGTVAEFARKLMFLFVIVFFVDWRGGALAADPEPDPGVAPASVQCG